MIKKFLGSVSTLLLLFIVSGKKVHIPSCMEEAVVEANMALHF